MSVRQGVRGRPVEVPVPRKKHSRGLLIVGVGVGGVAEAAVDAVAVQDVGASGD